MICRDSTHDDLKMIAKCHIKAFPKSLSSRLGLNYAARMISFYLEDDRGVLLHVKDGDEITGYCGGLMNRVPGRHGSTTSMTQHTFRALILNLMIRPWLVFHHEIRANILLIIKNIKLRFSGGTSKKVAPQTTWAEEFIPSMGLVVIGVSPEHQGKGYGSLLLKEFESKARKEGFAKIHLSVRKNNNQAITAYKRNGWMVAKEDPSELHMFKDLDLH